jgi:hypothetical protein
MAIVERKATDCIPVKFGVVHLADMLEDEYQTLHKQDPKKRRDQSRLQASIEGTEQQPIDDPSLASTTTYCEISTDTSGDANTLRELWEKVHDLDGDGRTALCLSGGGVRSAAFNLGILQGLARLELLDRFHYLSTVSGGGYIGCWLSAWRHRCEKGLSEVISRLSWPDWIGESINAGRVPEALSNLRRDSNYLRFFADCCCEKGAPSGQLEVKTPLYLPCPSWATG